MNPETMVKVILSLENEHDFTCFTRKPEEIHSRCNRRQNERCPSSQPPPLPDDRVPATPPTSKPKNLKT